MSEYTRILDEHGLITKCPNCLNRIDVGDFRRNRDITLHSNPFCSLICKAEFLGRYQV